MSNRERRNAYPRAIVFGVLGGLTQAALAQTTTVDVGGPKEEQAALQEVVVTGTSIRGIAPVGSEPIAYGRADIEADSPVDIRDALANVPQLNNFGTDADQSTSNRFRTAGFQPIIHNLGIYSTLTLFNGHRMADVGGEAVFPDPAILPTIAIQRIDVIADGSSAIYGSDAVAGVVNFLYRRGVEGFDVSFTEGIDPSTSWSNRNIGALWGHQFDRGEVMVAYEFSKHVRPLVSEFPFTADANHTALGGTDTRTTNCEYPIVRYGTTNYSGPSLTTAAYRCNPDGGTHLADNGDRHAVLVTGRFQPMENLDLWTELNFSDYSSYQIAPWGNGGRWQVNVPSTSPNFRVPTGAAAGQTIENNRGDGVGVFGYRNRIADSRVQGATFGADISLGNEWQTTLMLHKSRTFDYIDDPGLDLQNLSALLISGQFNPFNLTGNADAVKAQINNGFTQLNDTSQTLTELSAKLDGPLFALPGGDVLAAIGASHRSQRARQVQTGGCQTCSFYQVLRDDDIERGVNAVFAELAVPIVGESNAKPGIRKLTLSVAGRHDDYDGLPSQFNPKLGLDWTVIDGLRLHGTWGKSYVAPNMGLITSIFGVPQPGISDRVGTSTTNSALDIYNLGGGNPDLTPEKAKSHSFGVNWAPEFVSGLRLGATYYNVEYSNLIYKPTRADVLTNPAFVASRVLGAQDPTNPNVYLPLSAAYVAQLIAAAPPQTPITPGQTFNMSFNSFAINLGTRVHAGIDFDVRYDFDSRIGGWRLGAVANKQTKFDEQVVPGSVPFSRIGTGDAPPWAARLQAEWTAPGFPLRVGLVTNYKSGYTDVGFAPVPDTFIHNLTLGYDFEKLFRGVTAQVRVRNLTDKEPPFYNVVEGYDDDQATPYGRQFDLTIRARF
jgi:iron complex outermembrane receptor protein